MSKQYQIEFMKFKDELTSFLFRLLTNKQDTEDVVQDTFVKTFEKLDTFNSQSSFKTWVFTIGLNLAKNHLSKQKRWTEDFQDHGAEIHLKSASLMEKMWHVFAQTPEKDYEIKEHINYCFNCISKTLLLKQQVSLLLKEV